jgi:glycine/D-amino acid oxidase-like deaminating enzyme
MTTSDYDVVIVGGGVAGLAIAEIFARSGRSVALLERNARLCQEASASHHGWFHFGSLYSIFPSNQFLRTMVGGVEDLLAYYQSFEGMNIQIQPDGRLAFPQSPHAWFRDEPIEYLVSARNDPDFNMRRFDGFKSYAEKAFFLLTWELAIKQFISRHQRFHKHNWAGPTPASEWIPRAGFADYTRDVISKPNNAGVALDRDTHFRIVGYDRPMQSTDIVTDLVAQYLAAAGTVQINTEVTRIETLGSQKRVHTTTGSITAKTVILAAGKFMGALLERANGVKVVASPLLVAYPAVADTHIVRMTPFVTKSINHLHHSIDGKRYSVIGGGAFADPNDPHAVARANDDLRAMAHVVFPNLEHAQVNEIYLGYKTEIVAKSGERNYQYFIREVNDGIYAIVPGKFSLAFSLAVNTFKRITGDEPATRAKPSRRADAHTYVGIARHAAIVRDGLAINSVSRPSQPEIKL